jgi:hypothetical protein
VHIITTQSAEFALGFTAGVTNSIALDKCYYTIIVQNGFTALLILRALHSHFSLSPAPVNH